MAPPIVFFGTPEPAADVLVGLLEGGCHIRSVVTAADKRRGRGGELVPSPVARVARSAGLSIRHEVPGAGESLWVGAVGVVVAFGSLLPAELVTSVPMINVHFSLLPRWRGAAPVERAILAGDTETGVCIMRMDEGLDTGDIIAVARSAIGSRDTTADVRSRLVSLALPLLLKSLESGDLSGIPQSGEVSYAHKITSMETEIDWSTSTAEIERRIRAFRCHSCLAGTRISIVEAEPAGQGTTPLPAEGTLAEGALVATHDGWLRLLRVRPAGRPTMSGQDWWRGLRVDHPVFGRCG